MKNKLILFDWGNIVESHTTGYTCYDAWNDLLKVCGYNGTENTFKIVQDYNFQCIQTFNEFEKVYNQISEKYNLKTTYLEFSQLYKKIFDKIDYYNNVAEYEKSLKDRCYIGIFSNLTILDKDRLNKQVGLSNYDYAFLSFEIGCVKPQKEIYEKVNKKIQISSENILFIDDAKENIDAAKEFGWNTVIATGLELDKIKKHCEEFLAKNN